MFIAFLLLSPHISSRINPLQRKTMWSDFEKKIITKKDIDPKEFWQFRDFYYPGALQVNTFGLNKDLIIKESQTVPFLFSKYNDLYPFLIYKSDKIKSIEYLTKENTINKIGSLSSAVNLTVNNDHILFYTSQNVAYLFFVKPVGEMLQANGFFDFKKRDKELLKDKYWFVETSIILN